MDRDISEDQRMLLDASARFIEQVCPLPRVRAGAFADHVFAADYRRRAGELGWFSMLVPEHLGGGSVSGNGVLDAALVAFKRGCVLQPGAFVGTNVVAYALGAAGNDDQQAKVLPLLLSGQETASWVVSAPSVLDPDGGSLRARPGGSGFVLSGTTTTAHDADAPPHLLVTATADEGLSQFLLPPDTPGVSVTPLEGLDLTRRYAEVRLADVELPLTAVVGAPGQASGLVAQQLAIACVLVAAESVGAMHQDFETALQYAKDRVAFGRPIGSFQAVKHLLADTSLNLEMSKAITLGAATSVGADDGNGLEAASIAKAFVGDVGVDLAQSCFQVFGGIGFTWEHDQHLYLRRLTSDAAMFGNPVWHREHLCRLSGL